jgi:rod shape-determining protein MreC
MLDFFKSKFFLVLVCVALVLVIVPTTLSSMGLNDYMRSAAVTVLSPLQKLANAASDALDGFSSYFTEFDRIVEENNELRSRLEEMEDKVSAAEEVEKMNEWLYSYLELKREHTDYTMVDAEVTGRESGNYMTVFTLDKGESQGIEVDMPVISGKSVVGYITETGGQWSKAATILESGVALGGMVERTGELGVVEGDYTLSDEGLCRMVYLDAESDIVEGDRILTSGYGSVYPRGLVVGYVESVEKDPNSRSIVAYIRPSAPLEDIDRMMVITDYEIYTE